MFSAAIFWNSVKTIPLLGKFSLWRIIVNCKVNILCRKEKEKDGRIEKEKKSSKVIHINFVLYSVFKITLYERFVYN